MGPDYDTRVARHFGLEHDSWPANDAGHVTLITRRRGRGAAQGKDEWIGSLVVIVLTLVVLTLFDARTFEDSEVQVDLANAAVASQPAAHRVAQR